MSPPTTPVYPPPVRTDPRQVPGNGQPAITSPGNTFGAVRRTGAAIGNGPGTPTTVPLVHSPLSQDRGGAGWPSLRNGSYPGGASPNNGSYGDVGAPLLGKRFKPENRTHSLDALSMRERDYHIEIPPRKSFYGDGRFRADSPATSLNSTERMSGRLERMEPTTGLLSPAGWQTDRPAGAGDMRKDLKDIWDIKDNDVPSFKRTASAGVVARDFGSSPRVANLMNDRSDHRSAHDLLRSEHREPDAPSDSPVSSAPTAANVQFWRSHFVGNSPSVLPSSTPSGLPSGLSARTSAPLDGAGVSRGDLALSARSPGQVSPSTSLDTTSVPAPTTSSPSSPPPQKRPRLGWGQGLVAFEKKVGADESEEDGGIEMKPSLKVLSRMGESAVKQGEGALTANRLASDAVDNLSGPVQSMAEEAEMQTGASLVATDKDNVILQSSARLAEDGTELGKQPVELLDDSSRSGDPFLSATLAECQPPGTTPSASTDLAALYGLAPSVKPQDSSPSAVPSPSKSPVLVDSSARQFSTGIAGVGLQPSSIEGVVYSQLASEAVTELKYSIAAVSDEPQLEAAVAPEATHDVSLDHAQPGVETVASLTAMLGLEGVVSKEQILSRMEKVDQEIEQLEKKLAQQTVSAPVDIVKAEEEGVGYHQVAEAHAAQDAGATQIQSMETHGSKFAKAMGAALESAVKGEAVVKLEAMEADSTLPARQHTLSQLPMSSPGTLEPHLVALTAQERKQLIDNILAENNKMAAKTHLVFNGLQPNSALPDSSLSAAAMQAVHSQNQRRHAAVMEQMAAVLAKRKQALLEKERTLALEHRKLRELWKHRESLLSRSTGKLDLMERRPPLPPFRSSSRLRASMSDTVRSDYEELQVLSYLQAAEQRRTLVRVPPMILSERERHAQRLPSKNGLVEDPDAEEEQRKHIFPWSAAEQKIFLEKFALYNKNFTKIASFLEHRSTADCVRFYYQNQKSEEFQRVRSKQQLKKRHPRTAHYLMSYTENKQPASAARELSVKSLRSARFGGLDRLRPADSSMAADNASSVNLRPPTKDARSFGGWTPNGALITKASRSQGKHASNRGKMDDSAGEGTDDMSSPHAVPIPIVAKRIRSSVLSVSKGEAGRSPPLHDLDSRWTAGECERFVAGLAKFGKEFQSVAEYVGTKAPWQCKAFFSKSRKRLGLDKFVDSASDKSASQPLASADAGDAAALETSHADAATSKPADQASTPRADVVQDGDAGHLLHLAGVAAASLQDMSASVPDDRPSDSLTEVEAAALLAINKQDASIPQGSTGVVDMPEVPALAEPATDGKQPLLPDTSEQPASVEAIKEEVKLKAKAPRKRTTDPNRKRGQASGVQPAQSGSACVTRAPSQMAAPPVQTATSPPPCNPEDVETPANAAPTASNIPHPAMSSLMYQMPTNSSVFMPPSYAHPAFAAFQGLNASVYASMAAAQQDAYALHAQLFPSHGDTRAHPYAALHTSSTGARADASTVLSPEHRGLPDGGTVFPYMGYPRSTAPAQNPSPPMQEPVAKQQAAQPVARISPPQVQQQSAQEQDLQQFAHKPMLDSRMLAPHIQQQLQYALYSRQHAQQLLQQQQAPMPQPLPQQQMLQSQQSQQQQQQQQQMHSQQQQQLLHQPQPSVQQQHHMSQQMHRQPPHAQSPMQPVLQQQQPSGMPLMQHTLHMPSAQHSLPVNHVQSEPSAAQEQPMRDVKLFGQSLRSQPTPPPQGSVPFPRSVSPVDALASSTGRVPTPTHASSPPPPLHSMPPFTPASSIPHATLAMQQWLLARQSREASDLSSHPSMHDAVERARMEDTRSSWPGGAWYSGASWGPPPGSMPGAMRYAALPPDGPGRALPDYYRQEGPAVLPPPVHGGEAMQHYLQEAQTRSSTSQAQDLASRETAYSMLTPAAWQEAMRSASPAGPAGFPLTIPAGHDPRMYWHDMAVPRMFYEGLRPEAASAMAAAGAMGRAALLNSLDGKRIDKESHPYAPELLQRQGGWEPPDGGQLDRQNVS